MKTSNLHEALQSVLAITACAIAFSAFSLNYAVADTNQEFSADQQSSDKSDVAITRKIRQDLIKDRDLSVDAHNVKIITSNGMVTLKGPVQSIQEKSTIEHKAQAVAGTDNVHDQLEIARKN